MDSPLDWEKEEIATQKLESADLMGSGSQHVMVGTPLLAAHSASVCAVKDVLKAYESPDANPHPAPAEVPKPMNNAKSPREVRFGLEPQENGESRSRGAIPGDLEQVYPQEEVVPNPDDWEDGDADEEVVMSPSAVCAKASPRSRAPVMLMPPSDHRSPLPEEDVERRKSVSMSATVLIENVVMELPSTSMLPPRSPDRVYPGDGDGVAPAQPSASHEAMADAPNSDAPKKLSAHVNSQLPNATEVDKPFFRNNDESSIEHLEEVDDGALFSPRDGEGSTFGLVPATHQGRRLNPPPPTAAKEASPGDHDTMETESHTKHKKTKKVNDSSCSCVLM
jgi:hypothetical protein